ncbi:MAG: tRNA (adenosine(37)-N6)-threonylcarbamoyltransferase complex dimerization subunit type 1 TsaB [Alistipes sp.]|nr:tRNA (adenosine(37)-N6)-threonylcarbamoyltransferase complex dimerization subunit type 1 TsaB [Alistipes sp.]MBR2965301.1 tRNA (adenosine(37)-N6)-threonylcarbamoyltransferase complex dimerization subunit type 1 TsaB [Clostridia bacterium]
MKILALDTTAKTASVAVTENERVLGVFNVDNGLTQSELILPMAERLLETLKLSFSDVGLYAVTVGPGSFTGVRIGVSTVKGLAFGKDVPCAAVSTLEALAENAAGLRGLIVPCMDARRGQFYTATFSSDGSIITRLTPDRAISAEELAEELRSFPGDVFITGDGYDTVHRLLSPLGVKLSVTPELIRTANAASIAKIASRMYERGECVTERELQPTYLRIPQAERERLEREKNNM